MLENTAEAPRLARAWLKHNLALDDADVAFDAALMLSELVTNCHLHTRTEWIRVRAVLDAGLLRAEVHDDASGATLPQIGGNRAEGGRGLKEIVDEFSDDWGFENTPGLTVVWFVKKVPRPESPALRPPLIRQRSNDAAILQPDPRWGENGPSAGPAPRPLGGGR